MPDTVSVRFTRKPVGIADVKAAALDSSASFYEAEITETRQLTAMEYDYFIASFLKDRDWLQGKGGFKGEIHQVVEVTAPERDTLYVDPSGYSYARYVGMARSDCEVIYLHDAWRVFSWKLKSMLPPCFNCKGSASVFARQVEAGRKPV